MNTDGNESSDPGIQEFMVSKLTAPKWPRSDGLSFTETMVLKEVLFSCGKPSLSPADS